jgi:glycosyltransferase involved in cell wall biosynthesis
MRILWFSPTSSQYSKGSHHYYGGGWVEALEQVVAESPGIELGISFFHSTDQEKKQVRNVSYYPIRPKKKGNINKLITNWSGKLGSKEYVKKFLEVITDFKPDIIHIFGTEEVFAEIQHLTKIPVVLYLQGLINPYTNAFYPPGINNYNVLAHLPFLKNNILGNSLIFYKRLYEKKAEKELEYFKKSKYLIGRTCWDKKISNLLAPQAKYFHVDDILRSSFYEARPWSPGQHKRLQIISTLSGTIYKGLDLVLKTAFLLKKNFGSDFDWHIIGIEEQNKLVRFFECSLKKRFKDCNVSFLGVFPEAELIVALQAADMFIHPSYIDNSPNSLGEAQLLGMPVISCNVGGTSTLIEDDKNGILVPANAPYELAYSIISLAKDKNKAAQMGMQARAIATEKYERNKTFNAIMDVYQTIIKDNHIIPETVKLLPEIL